MYPLFFNNSQLLNLDFAPPAHDYSPTDALICSSLEEASDPYDLVKPGLLPHEVKDVAEKISDKLIELVAKQLRASGK